MTPEDENYTHIQNVYDSLRRIVPPEHYEEALAYRSQIDYRDMLLRIAANRASGACWAG